MTAWNFKPIMLFYSTWPISFNPLSFRTQPYLNTCLKHHHTFVASKGLTPWQIKFLSSQLKSKHPNRKMGMDTNRQFTKEEREIPWKYGRYSASLIVKEMHIEKNDQVLVFIKWAKVMCWYWCGELGTRAARKDLCWFYLFGGKIAVSIYMFYLWPSDTPLGIYIQEIIRQMFLKSIGKDLLQHHS